MPDSLKCLIVFAVLAVCSCSYDQVDVALRLAGDNRSELERVLRYFEKTGDKEKIAASRFLIGNMPGHKSMRGAYENIGTRRIVLSRPLMARFRSWTPLRP